MSPDTSVKLLFGRLYNYKGYVIYMISVSSPFFSFND